LDEVYLNESYVRKTTVPEQWRAALLAVLFRRGQNGLRKPRITGSGEGILPPARKESRNAGATLLRCQHGTGARTDQEQDHRVHSRMESDELIHLLVQDVESIAANMVTGVVPLDKHILDQAPLPACQALSPYLGWSVFVFALPITDEVLWIWHRSAHRRHLFANYLLLLAAQRVQTRLNSLAVNSADVAVQYPGVVSLVELAVRAGLGTRGLNNLLLHPEYGAWLQLHALVVEVPLPASPALAGDVCIRCARCIKACPAQAILGRTFLPEKCSQLVASPWMPRSKAIALTENSYVECAECVAVCPIGSPPERVMEWKR
jgi:ferredoxin